jgi:archaellum component FlaC
MTLSENDLLVRIADHVAKLSDIVTKQSKTILDLDSRINDLENRFKPFEKAVEMTTSCTPMVEEELLQGHYLIKRDPLLE